MKIRDDSIGGEPIFRISEPVDMELSGKMVWYKGLNMSWSRFEEVMDAAFPLEGKKVTSGFKEFDPEYFSLMDAKVSTRTHSVLFAATKFVRS